MPDAIVGPQKVTITPQVLQSGLNSVITLLQSTYQLVASKVPAGQEANFVGFDKLVPALNALNQSAQGVLTGEVDLRNWAQWAKQTANALVTAAQQVKGAKLDDGTASATAVQTKNSVDKVLATLGITTPPYLLLGAAAAALAGVAYWAYRQQKKERKSYGRDGGQDDEDEGEGEELDLSGDVDDDEPEDEGEDFVAPRPRRRPWASKEI